MEVSKKTIDVIKTFSSINSNLLLQPGNVIKTVSVAGNVFAIAEIDETIDQEFGIYNTSEFLGALSLFKEPQVAFGEKFAKISDTAGTYSLKYMGASKDILVYPQKKFVAPEYDVEFDISGEQLASILKGASIIGAPDLQVIRNDEGSFIRVCERKNPSSNDFAIQIGEGGEAYTFNLKVDNLKLYNGNQKVSISGKGLSKWENVDAKVTVYIALEAV